MIDDAKIKEIIEKTDIVSLVNQYTTLTKAGSDYKGLCPFHQEKTPSFMVSPSKKIAKCMGCGKGGNPITFLMQVKNIGFEDACIELADTAGVELNIKKKNSGPDLSKYYKIMDEAANFYHYYLVQTESGKKAIEYLEKRGITREIIDEYNIGLAPDKSDTLYQTLKDVGYNEIDLMDCGLIKSSEKGDSFYDFFRKRITFPVRDRFSNIVAFSARVFNGETDTGKYINSVETIIFKKNQTIFNIDKAQPYILKKKRLILHEGQMDVLASVRAGLGEAVCTLGTAFNENHVKLLKNFTNDFVLCFDGDNAGVNGMMKAIKLLKADPDIKISLVRLEGAKDPDEYVEKFGKEKYVEFFESHIQSPNDFIYEYYTKGKNLNDLSTAEEVKQNLFKFFKSLNSRLLVESYINRFSNDSGISPASLFLDYNGFIKGSVITKEEPAAYKPVKKAIEPVGYTAGEWDNLMFRLRAELRLFNYAKTSKELALKLDRRMDHKRPLYSCFDEIHQALWDELINTYYGMYETYNEGQFLSMLTDQKFYNCLISDKKTLYNLKEVNNYSAKDMEDCVNAVFYSIDIPKENANFKNQSEADQINDLNKILESLRRIDKKRKDQKNK